MGKNLELVPAVCTDRVLQEMFTQIDTLKQLKVASFEVVKYFDQYSSKTAMQLKNELVKSLKDKPCAQLFSSHPEYIKSKKLSYKEFITILK